MIGESILRLKRERAADSVKAINWIAWNDGELIDGVLRDEVPIDDDAKDFVDTNSILVDGESLRRADHRRSNKAAIIDIGLKLVASLAAQGDTRQRSNHGLHQVG